MGLTLQFAIGNKTTIINALEKFDLDFFSKLEEENQLADFSFHLIPNDLNLLVSSAVELKDSSPFGLREFLDTQTFYFDSNEKGAYLVDPVIYLLFSEFEENEALEITTKWFDKMRKAHSEEIEISDEVVVAVKQLIAICKDAEVLNLDLVHIWYS